MIFNFTKLNKIFDLNDLIHSRFLTQKLIFRILIKVSGLQVCIENVQPCVFYHDLAIENPFVRDAIDFEGVLKSLKSALSDGIFAQSQKTCVKLLQLEAETRVGTTAEPEKASVHGSLDQFRFSKREFFVDFL